MKNQAHTSHPSVNKIKNTKVGNDYSIKYVQSPRKSYLVNPLEGEIDYSLAYKNYDKFVSKVSN